MFGDIDVLFMYQETFAFGGRVLFCSFINALNVKIYSHLLKNINVTCVIELVL
jgi:hypothetical protein